MEGQKVLDRLSSFTASFEGMIAKNSSSATRRNWIYSERPRVYSVEEIETIINSSSLEEKQKLSRDYFYKDGIYKRLIIYYATLLKYLGILIPNPSFGQELSTSYIKKRYFNAMNLIDELKIPTIAVEFAKKALVEGCYFGIYQVTEKGKVYFIDLPVNYCRTRFTDFAGNDIVEFNITYFDSIIDEEDRKLFLSAYPKEVQSAYRKYKRGKLRSVWVMLSTDCTICLPFFYEGGPLFLSTIESVEKYKDGIDNEIERDIDEIRKIIVQKIPHMQDGRLVFEPPEAEEMHAGAVGMLKGNPNISVLRLHLIRRITTLRKCCKPFIIIMVQVVNCLRRLVVLR